MFITASSCSAASFIHSRACASAPASRLADELLDRASTLYAMAASRAYAVGSDISRRASRRVSIGYSLGRGGRGGRTRTDDQSVMSARLWPLSYPSLGRSPLLPSPGLTVAGQPPRCSVLRAVRAKVLNQKERRNGELLLAFGAERKQNLDTVGKRLDAQRWVYVSKPGTRVSRGSLPARGVAARE